MPAMEARVAEEEPRREVVAEPAGVRPRLHLGDAGAGAQRPVAAQAAKARAVEKERVVHVVRPQGDARLLAARSRISARKGLRRANGGAEVVGLEAALVASQDDVDRAVAAAERREPDAARAVHGHRDRPRELHVLEDARLDLRQERGRRLRHRLQADHGGQERDPVEDVVGEVRVGRRGQLRLGDELDARIVEQRPLEEAQQRQLAPLELDGGRGSEATGRDDGRRQESARAPPAARRRRRPRSRRRPRARARRPFRDARPCRPRPRPTTRRRGRGSAERGGRAPPGAPGATRSRARSGLRRGAPSRR